MRTVAIIVLFIITSPLASTAQSEPKPPPPKGAAASTSSAVPAPVDPVIEKQRWEAALAETSALEKALLLKAFLEDFPGSANISRARELLVVARAAAGDEKFRIGERESGIALFRDALADAPMPYPARLFNEVISKFPASLFFRGEQEEGIAAAKVIEKAVADDAGRLTELANFYLSIENGAEAKRLAESALVIEPNWAPAFQALGLANRLNFDLDAATAAFAKGAEVDPSAVSIKRNLADMYRALAKPAEAEAIYRELLAASPDDISAKTGAILSLFEQDKRNEAEAELAAALESNANNVILLAGAALWYASNSEPEMAAAYAEKAAALEPRYVWSHIALARARMMQNDPLGAERALLAARRFGNFPTLEYELAAVRLSAGFYRDAAEGLARTFSITDGRISTKLGGRVLRGSESFGELLAPESRASVFRRLPEISPEISDRLRTLLEFTKYTSAESPKIDAATADAADKFIAGSDRMKLHRQLFAASVLLERSMLPEKILSIAQEAIGTVETGLEISNPAAAVMASELYEARQIAFARDEFVKIPEIPRTTLSNILRGRIEEISGWALFRLGRYPESLVRLRRAISVLPEKSAWWRSTLWRLGSAYEANGKPEEALDSYIRAYRDDNPSPVRYVVIESLYRKIKGNTDGLETLIGRNPLPPIAAQAAETPIIPQAAATEVGGDPKVTEADTAEAVPTNAQTPSETKKPPPAVEKSGDAPAAGQQPSITPEPEKSDNEPANRSEGDPNALFATEKELKTEAPREKKPESADEPKRTAIAETEPGKETGIPEAASGGQKAVGEKPSAEPAANQDVGTSVAAANIKPPSPAPKAVQGTAFDPIIITFGRKPSDSGVAAVTQDAAVPVLNPQSKPAPEAKEPIPVEEIPKAQERPAGVTETPATDAPSTKSKPADDKPTDPEKGDETPPALESKSEPAPGADASAPSPISPPFHLKEYAPQPDDFVRGDTVKARADIDPLSPIKTAETAEKTISSEASLRENTGEKAKPSDDAATAPSEESKPEDTEISLDAKPEAAGDKRQRVVNEPPADSAAFISPCWIFVSKESIEVSALGQDVGLLVGIDGGDAASIRAKATSDEDIEFRLTNEVAGVAGRAFLVVRSKSGRPGRYTVLLAAPCARKEITITVK